MDEGPLGEGARVYRKQTFHCCTPFLLHLPQSRYAHLSCFHSIQGFLLASLPGLSKAQSQHIQDTFLPVRVRRRLGAGEERVGVHGVGGSPNLFEHRAFLLSLPPPCSLPPPTPASPGVLHFLLFSDTITLPPLSLSSAQTLLLPLVPPLSISGCF